MTRACGHCRPTKAWNHKNDTIYLPLGTTQMIRSGVTPDKRSTRTIPSFKVTLECFRIQEWQFLMSNTKSNFKILKNDENPLKNENWKSLNWYFPKDAHQKSEPVQFKKKLDSFTLETSKNQIYGFFTHIALNP